MSEKKLIRNAIKCLKCGDVVESTYRHDFRWCGCGAVGNDGGLDYCRRTFSNKDDYEDVSEWSE